MIKLTASLTSSKEEGAKPCTPPPTSAKKRSHDSAFSHDPQVAVNDASFGVAVEMSIDSASFAGASYAQTHTPPRWGGKRARSERYARADDIMNTQVGAPRKSKRVQEKAKKQVVKPVIAVPTKKKSAAAAVTAAGAAPKKRGRKPGTKNKRPADATADATLPAKKPTFRLFSRFWRAAGAYEKP